MNDKITVFLWKMIKVFRIVKLAAPVANKLSKGFDKCKDSPETVDYDATTASSVIVHSTTH